MLKIKIVAVGRLKEQYLRDASAEYEKRLSQREEAIQIYLNLSDQYMQLDYQGSLDEVYVKAHCLYRLGELYQKQQNTEKAQAAYQNAVGLCSKARETNEDDLRIMRLFLLSSVKLLNLNATNSSAEEYKRLRVLAENYHKRFPTRQASQLLAEVYFELQREDAGFLRMAYSIYETLCNEYPEIYSSDLWRFRKYMWGKKLLDEPYFQKRTLPIFLQDKNRFWFGIDSMAKTKYAFELFFVACEPLGEIEKITITEYKYKTLMRDTVSQRQIAPPTQFLQICEIKTDQRAALIPDERVLITYKNGKTVEYAVCFG